MPQTTPPNRPVATPISGDAASPCALATRPGIARHALRRARRALATPGIAVRRQKDRLAGALPRPVRRAAIAVLAWIGEVRMAPLPSALMGALL